MNIKTTHQADVTSETLRSFGITVFIQLFQLIFGFMTRRLKEIEEKEGVSTPDQLNDRQE